MILICKNYNENNESHEDVIDWLQYHNAKFDFLSAHKYYENGNDWSIELTNSKNQRNLLSKEYKSVWFRGFMRHRSHFKSTISSMNSTNDNISELRWRLGQEVGKINAQIFKSFEHSFQLPNPKSIG